jgi:hypothetical protein
MTAHSRIGNRLYVQGICPFARCESRLNHPATGGRAFYIYDKRSGKLLAGPHKTQARAWRSLAVSIQKNGGTLIYHVGISPYSVVNS